jgi:dynein heavy chain
LAVTQVHWTHEAEAAINNGKLETYKAKCDSQIDDIVDLVRHKLDPLVRSSLTSLIVLDVHARDVVADLISKQVTSIDDFDWISQLRYEYDPDIS